MGERRKLDFGDVQARSLHYEMLVGYYHDAAGVAKGMHEQLKEISAARTGLPQLQHELTKLRNSVDGARLGEVIEEIWIVTLKQIAGLMEDILLRRNRIAVAIKELETLQNMLAAKQRLIADWYTEEGWPG